MQIKSCSLTELNTKTYIIPFTKDATYNVSISKEIDTAIGCVLSERFTGDMGEIFSLNTVAEGNMVELILVGLGDIKTATNRKLYLSFLKAMKKALDTKNNEIAVILNNTPELLNNKPALIKLVMTPYMVSYSFDIYKTGREEVVEKTVAFVSDMSIDKEIYEAKALCTGSTLSRNLINHPSMYMTPTQLANDTVSALTPLGVEVVVMGRKEIENLKMGCFLSVSKGATEEPKFIVMRYMGDPTSDEKIGLIGKGLTFDSGGYTLKEKMATMHADMGGAGAVIGAMSAIAQMKLPINVVTVVAACENKISAEAYVPGDILFSMNGKTVEMLNADAEGRLTLVDAITYAIRHEGVGSIIDIATLTGAAKGAVGNKTAPVLTNNDNLWAEMQIASDLSCEKIWRLDLDEELRSNLNSAIADIKNSNPGSTYGGGTIMAALFIKDFIEDKPWVHIDMAAVNQVTDDPALCKGATGYGVSLLYNLVKGLSERKI